ncbi:MAG: nucleoside kinase [Clostridiales bacterium]|nr:nucleoside kinase [Clostridiales bacterium]
MAEINNYIEYINEYARRDKIGLIAESEQRYRNIISAISGKISKSGYIKIIMLAGPSSSGKTTTAGKLSQALLKNGVKAHEISLDDFYLNREDAPLMDDGTPDFETVHALDLPLLKTKLSELLKNGESELPLFDFNVGRRSDKSEYLKLEENDLVIIEGLHALNPIIIQELDTEKILKLYVSVSSRIYDEKQRIILNKRNLRFVRRMLRDEKFRASPIEHTYSLWDSVLHGEDLYLTPYKRYADMLINSIHIYEPCVFGAEAIKMLKTLPPENKHFNDSQRLIRALECFEPIDSSLVPTDSLLREFLGSEENPLQS